MLDEPTRKAYLDAMGVTEWVKPDALEQGVSQPESLQPSPKPEPIEQQPEATVSTQSAQAVSANQLVPGLKLLNQGSINGLLVVLPHERSELSNEARVLMSKMLNSIHFLPKETAFAVTADAEQSVDLSSIKAILVMGNEAGQSLVKVSGGSTIAGGGYIEIAGIKAIVSWHPEELVTHPEHKKHAWQDLKQLVELFKQAS